MAILPAVAVVGGGLFAGVFGGGALLRLGHNDKTAQRTNEHAATLARVAAVQLVKHPALLPDALALARLWMVHAWKESAGNASAVGDMGAPHGPGVGLGQVNRGTAKELGLWSPPSAGMTPEDERAAYLSAMHEPAEQLHALIVVWLDKLRAVDAKGQDDGLTRYLSASRRYNGGGAAARGYVLNADGPALLNNGIAPLYRLAYGKDAP